ncbi:molybdopterin cofactor-binding domain-containing protein [Chitinimonas sp.]|uniref:xanthine dehydrogenase family protein molybdopterin-binding subunit n=1 Tax=Chitinimonas sp. TaxID=1934313 RepID=UPI0035B1B4D6
MSQLANPSRRRFLASTFALGAWTLGGFPALAADAPSERPSGFGLWLRFAADGQLTVLSNVAEIGQGTHSTVAQLAAEELAMPVSAIRVEQAPVSAPFIDPLISNYATFGSLGFRLSLRSLGPVCAAARDMLVRAAAARWQIAAGECQVADAAVHHPASGRTLPYTALLAEAAALTPPEKPVRKPREQWTVLGKSLPRSDIPAKVDGSAIYGMDVDRPGMLVATVLHAPTFGGKLISVDERPAKAIKGVRQVVRLPGAVAVVADGYWPALKGARALKPKWQDGPHAHSHSKAFRQRLLAAARLGRGADFDQRDDKRMDIAGTADAIAKATAVVDATYDVPFLAHATLEPMNATVEVRPDSAELWLSTQSALDTQKGVAKALGLPLEKVTVHPQLSGGGFGRRLEHGFAIEAALIAKAVGKPVKMIWSREVDMRAGGYRPAVAARLRLALGPDMLPTALRVDLANPSLLEYSGLSNGPPSDLDWSTIMGLNAHRYAIPKAHLSWTRVDEGVPCGYFRSVGASQNVFFLEHSIDRAARLAGIDPRDYRRTLFAKARAELLLVDALCLRASWDQPLPAGHYRGMAISMGNDAISGHVVEISVPAPGQFRLHRITAAIDVGVVANPRIVEAQMMGGTLFGLSAALFSEITLKDGQIEQGNFDSYRVARLADVPPLDVLVLANGETDRPRGAGEEGVASIAPAIANALLAATGKPVERLPLSQAGWTLITG